MFPISSTSLSGPNAANFPLVTPTAGVASVNSSTVDAVGSALDAPAPASVTIDLSPVANFLMTVSQSRQQITQLQASVANGEDPQEAAVRAATLNDATQNVVNAFNLLPSVELDQSPLQGPSLLNSLVEGLNRQTANQLANEQGVQPQSAAQSLAQNLAQIGVTLQPPLLSDAAGGLSLDNEILRASFNTDNQTTTNTLQNTLDTFSELATRFAEQLSAASSGALPSLVSAQQPALTPADLAANARLDIARAELDLLSQIPYQETAADVLASQRAALEQPLTRQNTAPESPLVNPLRASTAEVIAAQNAEAQKAREAGINALASQQSPQAQTAQALQAADQPALDRTTQANELAATQAATQQADAARAADAARVQTASDAARTADAARAQTDATAAANANNNLAQAAADAARTTAARQQAAAGLDAATAASNQAAAQAIIAQNAAAASNASDRASATAEQQAFAQQTAVTNLAAADAAAASAQAQAQAAQSAADALAAQSAAATAAAAQARAALDAPSTREATDATDAATASAAQQAGGVQTTAGNPAAINAADADAAQQAQAAQVAAQQAAALQTNPLQGNPALAAAIAAYNISDPALLGANARATQSTVSAIPRVGAVAAATSTRSVGPGE